MKWGGLAVSGAGIGVWSGTGNGGSIDAAPFILDHAAIGVATGFPTITVATAKLLRNLAEVLALEFDSWANSIEFKAVSYVGTTTATPIAPGTFDAHNVSVPLSSIASRQLISGLSQKWNDKLRTEENGIKFLLDDPGVKTKDMTLGIGDGIERAFSNIWMKSPVSSNSVSGPAAPGGVGSGSSQMNGKVL